MTVLGVAAIIAFLGVVVLFGVVVSNIIDAVLGWLNQFF